MNSQCRWQINFPLPLSKKDNERLVTVRPRLTLTHNRLKLWQQQQALSPTLCGLTLTFGVKSFLEVEQHVCKPPHFIDQLHDVVGIGTRHVHAVWPRADGAQRAALRRSAQTPRHWTRREGEKVGVGKPCHSQRSLVQSSAALLQHPSSKHPSCSQFEWIPAQRSLETLRFQEFPHHWQLVLCAQCSQRMVKPLMFKDKNTSICLTLPHIHTGGNLSCASF